MFWPFWHHCFLARPFLSKRINENLNPFDIPTVPLCRLSWSACTIVLWVAKCCLSKQRQITMPSHGRPNEKPKPKVYNMLNVLVLAVTFWHDWVCPSWILQDWGHYRNFFWFSEQYKRQLWIWAGFGKGKDVCHKHENQEKQGHALVKARGLLGSVCVWLTSLLWCFDMCYWRPLFLARPATNLVSKFWPVPLWSLHFLASGSARPKHRGKWRFFHSPCLLFLICLTIQAERIRFGHVWSVYRSTFRSTLNTSYITGLGMCKVCTEAVQSIP